MARHTRDLLVRERHRPLDPGREYHQHRIRRLGGWRIHVAMGHAEGLEMSDPRKGLARTKRSSRVLTARGMIRKLLKVPGDALVVTTTAINGNDEYTNIVDVEVFTGHDQMRTPEHWDYVLQYISNRRKGRARPRDIVIVSVK
jgi:hypothetical protein